MQKILSFAEQSPCRYVVTPNSDHIVQLENDSQLQAVYRNAHLVVADGMPLIWASHLLSQALPERITGSELMPELCAEAAIRKLRVYILGGPPDTAAQAAQKLQQRFPGLIICGWDCPVLGFEHDPLASLAIIQKIKLAQPQLIFVGLGAPKQELWMHRHYQELPSGVLLGIGAAIEFSAGTLRRAPKWMQKIGAEWFYRLLQNPRRLAKRYARDTWIVWIVLRTLMNQWLHADSERDIKDKK